MNENNNIDKYLKNSFESFLMQKTGQGFTDKIMHEIELARKFEKEDKKTTKMISWISVSASLFTIFAGALIIYFIAGSSGDNSKSDSIVTTLNNSFTFISNKLFLLFGLPVSGEVMLYISSSLIAIILITVFERLLVKRKIN